MQQVGSFGLRTTYRWAVRPRKFNCSTPADLEACRVGVCGYQGTPS